MPPGLAGRVFIVGPVPGTLLLRRSRRWEDGSVELKFDPEADAAYVRIVDHIGAGEAVAQVWVEDDRLRGAVILDLDEDGFLLGVEVLGAAVQLRPATLASARHFPR